MVLSCSQRKLVCMADPTADDAEKAAHFSRRVGARMHRAREAIRRRPVWNIVYKGAITAVGVIIILAGIAMLALPGPGWLTIFVGLTLLGSEYHWARRLLTWLRKKLAQFWEWWNAWRARRRAKKAAKQAEKVRAREAGS